MEFSFTNKTIPQKSYIDLKFYPNTVRQMQATSKDRLFLIPFLALGTALTTLKMEWATALRWSAEAADRREWVVYKGMDVLNANLVLLPPLFYIACLMVVLLINITSIKVNVAQVYKVIFWLNLLIIGAFLFVMIIDYHVETYFETAEAGYWIWLVANAVLCCWLYAYQPRAAFAPSEEELLDDWEIEP